MEKINLNRILKDIEIDYIKKALYQTGNNTTEASELLGLRRTTLVEKLKAYDMSVPRKWWRHKVKKDIALTESFASINNVEHEIWKE